MAAQHARDPETTNPFDGDWADCKIKELLDNPGLHVAMRQCVMSALNTVNVVIANCAHCSAALLRLLKSPGSSRVLDLAAGHVDSPTSHRSQRPGGAVEYVRQFPDPAHTPQSRGHATQLSPASQYPSPQVQ